MEQIEPKRILVTGGTGFAGTNLVLRLLGEGHEVISLDHRKGLEYEELLDAGAELVLGSVTDRELVDRLVHKADVVFHLAAAFREVNLTEEEYWDVNVGGTINVMEAAKANGVRRVIYCSTCGVHGDVKRPPASEDAPIQPADYYQHTKYEGEKVAREFGENGLETVILRPTAIYGPGDPERWLLLFKRVNSGLFPLFGNGQASYHPLYVDNLTDAFMLTMECDKAVGETYLVADADYFTVKELVTEVGRALGRDVSFVRLPFWPLWFLALLVELVFKPLHMEPPIFRRRVDWYRQNRAFSIDKIVNQLGFEPRVRLQEGLAQTAQWYKEHGYL